ncbi:bone morphogenetic protein 3 isoform X2 [Rhinatrema bivittatum]|uniref:bone morphogenetic protein 3 isoform X2 n=1 Tax=Rhinatrema bivittatum TaxID=194408 RepID=UPI00112C8B32|nr:bone morphogenetic protein 3 isoform X2 [Rhinatrema bivittatum]
MAARARWLVLCLGCSCLLLLLLPPCPGRGEPLRRRRRSGGAAAPAREEPRLPPGDTVSEHMLRLYQRYRGARRRGAAEEGRPRPLRDGNTVRSFRALSAGSPGNKELHIFNLTSLTRSENILSATLHYYVGDLLIVNQSCPHSKGCPPHGQRKAEIPIDLSVWSLISPEKQTEPLGHFVVSVPTVYRDFLAWQWKDITEVLSEAKQKGHLLIGIKMTLEGRFPWRRLPSSREPYILVYANDSAISEPDSVVSSLQGHRSSLTGGPGRLVSHSASGVAGQRQKRSTNVLLPLQNNELPGAEYQHNEDEAWGESKPYKTLQARPADKAKIKKKQKKSNRQKSQTLQFDEQTLKKARRKQWNEPRNCARRNLKVDFADIGWSDWIIAPKSFDSYYCSGACQFPMPKSSLQRERDWLGPNGGVLRPQDVQDFLLMQGGP